MSNILVMAGVICFFVLQSSDGTYDEFRLFYLSLERKELLEVPLWKQK